MTTFAQLEQKRQAGSQTPAEKKQWEVLFNQDDYAIEQVFRVPVNGKVAIPNEANRRLVRQWAEGEPNPINTEVWFANIFRENPNLVHQLSWQDQKMLDPAYRAQLEKKNETQLRARFLEICKANGLANNDANFTTWVQSGPDPVVSWFNSKPVIVLEDGTTLELVPATQEQIDQWKQDLEQKQFSNRQQALAEAAVKNDIATLRRMAAEETTQKHRTQYELRRDFSMLKNFITRGEKDKEPLPTHYRGQPLTADTIKKGGKEVIVDLGKRCGFERLNALLHGFDIEPFFENAPAKLAALEAEFGERNFTF